MNQLTHYLDGSVIYGTSERKSRTLRNRRGGLLRTQRKNLLPIDPNASEECQLFGTGFNCFFSGDSRTNVQPDLAIIHTLWVRQHNKVVSQLAQLNNMWDSEILFQEARKIVVAQFQHIVFNEWLPVIIGIDAVISNDLLPRRSDYNNVYNQLVNPAILNEFSTVAQRFGHSQVQGSLRLFSGTQENRRPVKLREFFNTGDVLYQRKKFDELIGGLINQPTQKMDSLVTQELTNRLFQTKQSNFGMDLVALNIQRGRDHGIPSYNALREVCGLKKAETFQELKNHIPPNASRPYIS